MKKRGNFGKADLAALGLDDITSERPVSGERGVSARSRGSSVKSPDRPPPQKLEAPEEVI